MIEFAATVITINIFCLCIFLGKTIWWLNTRKQTKKSFIESVISTFNTVLWGVVNGIALFVVVLSFVYYSMLGGY